MFKKLLQKSTSEVNLKRGSLKPSHLEPRFTAHHGIPASASLLAYEPVQRLLAVASRDGRIKIFGRDGVEVLFRSPTGAPCKYLEFVANEGRLIHVTTRNDIEIWDLWTNKLLTSKTWGLEITAFAVLQGTSFIYIGDESGQVSVLQADSDHGVLNQMNYSIFPQVTLCGLVAPGTSNAPSVVSILPQPDAVHSRICIVYGNGILVLWGIQEAQVLAILGGTGSQQRRLAGQKYSSEDDDEEDKEPCCACWACPLGTIVAVGYTDGDILLWNLSSKAKSSDQSSPLLKLCLSTEDFRMPVVVMRWSSSGRTEAGPCGFLYVFGGQEMGATESVTVLSVLNMAAKADLPLEGPFADVLLMPAGGSNEAVLVLTSPGCIEVYEELSISESIHSGGESPLAPTSFQLPLTFSPVNASRLLTIPEESIFAGNSLKTSTGIKSYITPALPSGARWPVGGGILASMPAAKKCLYVTGHENGLVNVWDVSSPCLYSLTTVNNRGLLGSELASIVAVDLCELTGLLAAGDESGLVYLYKMSAESRQGECLFITKNEAPTKKDLQHAAGFQCFAVLNLHQAAISSITVASHASCVAIGDDAGLVTLFDLTSNTVRFHGKCGTARVVSFTVMSLPSNESSSSTPASSSGAVFVLSRDASITAIDSSSGNLIGSGRPRNPSVALSLHLLDSGGALVKSASKSPSKKVTKQSVLMAVIETDSSGSRIEPASGSEERDEDIAQENDWIGTDNLLLLCSEDALRLYSISAVLQGMRNTVRKIKFEKPCRSASTFDAGAEGFGVLLLYDTGDIEIRSLPELDVVKVAPLSSCLGWEFTSSPSFYRTISVASNGRVAAIDADREVVFMSLVAEENDMRLPAAYPMLYDQDVAAATEAALKASLQAAKKKQSQLQDMFGGVMKELKHSLGSSAPSGDHSPGDLFKVFSRPVTSPISHGVSSIVQKLRPGGNHEKDRGSNNSSPEPGQVESPSSSQEPQLDIDDIDLDDDDSKSPSSSSASSGKKGGVMRKLRSSFKGKKKNSKLNDDEQRNMLFEGGSTEAKPAPKMPAMRSAEEIRAAYGHKRAGEASSVAAQARDRLMERQERLQNINRRTEEMQENAENFQSMAEELAKKMESKKWWEV